MSNTENSYDLKGIMECQLNRYPMLFIDSITKCVPLSYAEGYKLFSYNEWYFHGYETLTPKVWNVIQIEAMAQTFLMTILTADENKGLIAVSNKFNNVEFFKKIEPGDKLDLKANLKSFKRGVASGSVEGWVSEEIACSMECVIVIPDKFEFKSTTVRKGKKSKIGPDKLTRKIDFGIKELRECLLNKYPWLFIDRVLDIEPGKFAHVYKCFTYNEAFFPAHFPGEPSVPGFIQIETCMQAFLLTFLSLDEYKRKETADRKLTNVFVRKKVIPGDCFEIHAKCISFRRGIAIGRVESFVDGEPATSFDVVAVVTEELEKYKPKHQ